MRSYFYLRVLNIGLDSNEIHEIQTKNTYHNACWLPKSLNKNTSNETKKTSIESTVPSKFFSISTQLLKRCLQFIFKIYKRQTESLNFIKFQFQTLNSNVIDMNIPMLSDPVALLLQMTLSLVFPTKNKVLDNIEYSYWILYKWNLMFYALLKYN